MECNYDQHGLGWAGQGIAAIMASWLILQSSLRTPLPKSMPANLRFTQAGHKQIETAYLLERRASTPAGGRPSTVKGVAAGWRLLMPARGKNENIHGTDEAKFQ